MIVRVMGDGQYELAENVLERLNALDKKAMEALDREDEAELDKQLDQMGAIVRAEGTRLPDESLTPSQVVLPPSDFTLEETRKVLSEQGFIPDPSTA